MNGNDLGKLPDCRLPAALRVGVFRFAHLNR